MCQQCSERHQCSRPVCVRHSSAGIGISTAAGDAFGQHAQKSDLKKALDALSACEQRVLSLLEALIVGCFPDVPHDDWHAARGAGISFEGTPPEQLGSTVLAVGGATARGAASVASRIGYVLSTQALSVCRQGLSHSAPCTLPTARVPSSHDGACLTVCVSVTGLWCDGGFGRFRLLPPHRVAE